jgi:hypothetical protein
MTGEELTRIRSLVRRTPPRLWAYLPFVFPVLIVLVGIAVNVGIVIYFEKKAPDLQVLFKLGSKVQPVWDSQLIRSVVEITALSITITFVLLAFLARIAFRQACLLRAAAKDLGIEGGQREGRANGSQPSRSEASSTLAAGPRRSP